MRRREFVTLIGGAAVWPLAARAQHPKRMRRIGVLAPQAEDEPEQKVRIAAFLLALRELGWVDGDNVQFVYCWSNNCRVADQPIDNNPTDICPAIGYYAGSLRSTNANAVICLNMYGAWRANSHHLVGR